MAVYLHPTPYLAFWVPPLCRRIYANISYRRNPSTMRDPGRVDMSGPRLGCAEDAIQPSGHDRIRETYQDAPGDASSAGGGCRSCGRACGRKPASAGAEGPTDHSRCGNRAIAEGIHPADPASRRAQLSRISRSSSSMTVHSMLSSRTAAASSSMVALFSMRKLPTRSLGCLLTRPVILPADTWRGCASSWPRPRPSRSSP